MTFTELLNQYPYLRDCRIDKSLPKVLVITYVYNSDNIRIALFQTRYTLSMILNYLDMLDGIGCDANNEHELTEFLVDIVGIEKIRASTDISEGYATYKFERWI